MRLLSLVGLPLLTLLALPCPNIAMVGDAVTGKIIYERLCVNCHGQDGQGGSMGHMLPIIPRNLTDPTYMSTRSNQQLFTLIKQGSAAVGFSTVMRAFGDEISDQEIWDTVAYVRTLVRPQSVSPPSPTIASSGTTSSQDDQRIVHLRLSIWPEYDDPRVLIMLRGELAPHTTLPTRITFPIPTGAEVIGAGMISERNELLLHPYQVRTGETQNHIEVSLPVSRFFIEFYYNPLTSDTNKHFTYTLAVPYHIEHLEVDVQQPLHATNFTLTPQAIRQSTDDKGLTYHWLFYRNLKKDEATSFTITYTKTVVTSSVAKRQTEAAGAAQPRTTIDQTLTAIGLLFGTAVLLGGGSWLWISYQRRRLSTTTSPISPSLPTTRDREPTVHDAALPGTRRANFCMLCGRKLRPTYRFCPDCGTALDT